MKTRIFFDKILLKNLVNKRYEDKKHLKDRCAAFVDELKRIGCMTSVGTVQQRWIRVNTDQCPTMAERIKIVELFNSKPSNGKKNPMTEAVTIEHLNGKQRHSLSGPKNLLVSTEFVFSLVTNLLTGAMNTLGYRCDDVTLETIEDVHKIVIRIIPLGLLLAALGLGLAGHPIAALTCSAVGFLMGMSGLFMTKAIKVEATRLLMVGAASNLLAAIGFGAVAIKAHLDAQKAVRSAPLAATQPVAAKKEDKSDRKAAEYLKDIGGKGEVKDKDGKLMSLDNLPQEGIVLLKKVVLLKNEKVDDAGLAHFKDCRDLEHLELDVTNVSDAGMVAFNGIKSLKHLSVGQTKVTAAGLGNFKDCKGLTYLGLFGLQVGDAGFNLFRDCKNLTMLQLGQTRLTDEGLSICAAFKELEVVDVGGTKTVGDKWLGYLKGCPKLKKVGLGGTSVTDIGLSHLKECKNLEEIGLGFTSVTDQGLVHLRELKNLKKLDLKGTKVTLDGITALRTALGLQCVIEGP